MDISEAALGHRSPHECGTKVICPSPRPNAAVRLFCFHHAGGGASFFRDWPTILPTSIEVRSIQQPGREGLFRQPRHSDFEELIEHTLGAITPWLDRPFAFLGHSFGALVAYVCALRLIEQDRKPPSHLFVSAYRALGLPSKFELHSSMSDVELVAKLIQLGGLPGELADSRDFLDVYMPVLRGDMRLIEQFESMRPPENISVPITAFGGDSDTSVLPEEILQWSKLTKLEFDAHFFTGGHFFISDNLNAISPVITEKLASTITQG